jgi:hypothetical protein
VWAECEACSQAAKDNYEASKEGQCGMMTPEKKEACEKNLWEVL